jgi:malonyl-CoA/methylmalonyl-CoA synthetase
VVAGGTLPAVWARRWAGNGESKALLAVGAVATEPRWLGAGELDERSRAAAAGLATLGLESGSKVAWVAERSVESIVACIGIVRSGLVLVPVDTKATQRELRHVAKEVTPDVVVTDDPEKAAVFEDAAGSRVLVFGSSLSGLPAGTDDAPIDDVKPDAPALVGFTSGTTGAPKGAVLTHANLLANAESLRLAWRWSEQDRLVHALPLFHGHGLCAGLFGTLNAGASAVILPGFDPATVVDAVSRHSGTLFFGVPTMYHRIAASGRCADLGALRLAVSGSAALKAELHEQIVKMSGVSVLERYGMTETLLTVSNPVDGERRAGCIGFPLPGTEAVLGEQTDGELWVRGPTVFSGYLGKPAATAERFTSGGWFRTGDLGVVDDGYVRLLGRSSEVVISGGHNVYPAEVEDVLLTYPGIVDAAVSGTPSDEWGEIVTAWVVAESGVVDTQDLLLHVAADLAPYKRPRIVRQVESLPRNSMGKVKRWMLQ